MRIITQKPLSLLYGVSPSLPWEERDGPVLCLGALAAFALRQDMSRPLDCLADEETLWAVIDECLPEGDILDEGLPKPRSEFLAYGECHAASPVRSMECSVQVGQTVKRLTVFGDRFSEEGFVSEPEAFTSMPLTWANAFGGPDHPFNPLGKGYVASGLGSRRLPNILDERGPCGAHDPDFAPAGLGALPVHWPARSGQLGPLDGKWLRAAWPGLPLGTRKDFACRASADQRLNGFFAGGEAIVIQGMRPDGASIQSAVPRLRGRLFAAFAETLDAAPVEIPCVMETLWLFPGRMTGVLLFRGAVPVRVEECDDVAGVMAVMEDATLPPAPAETHLRAFQEAMAGEGPAMDTADADRPAGSGQAGGLAGKPEDRPQDLALRAEAEAMEREAGMRLKEVGRSSAEVERFLAQGREAPGPKAAATTTPGEFADAVERLRKEAADRLGPGGSGPEAWYRLAEKRPMGLLEASAKPVGAQGELQPVRSLLEREGLPAGVRSELEKALAGFAAVEAALAAGLAGTGAALDDPGPGQAGKASSRDPLHVPPSPGEPLSTEQALAILKEGGSLAACDLTRCDLGGQDLSGVDFQGALLSGVVWRDARMHGADMRGVIADHADFQGSVLDEAILDGADLEAARLKGCSARKCSAKKAQFQRADLSGCDLTHSDLTGADCTGALLEGAACLGIIGPNLRLQEADLRRACFRESDLTGSRADAGTRGQEADFSRATCADICWSGAALPGACFRDALLDDADLSACDMRESVLELAQARGVTLDKASLLGADLTGCNLFQASLRQADLGQSTVRHANLFGADLHQCRMDGAVLHEVNVGRTALDGGSLEAADD